MSTRGVGEESPSLTADEKRYFGQLFKAADTEGLGVITGEVAVKFFEKSGLPSSTLGQIWEISDKENTGFLTPQSFSVALRLIGQAQNGQQPEAGLSRRAGPLPRFEGYQVGAPSKAAAAPPAPKARTGLAPLTPEDRAKYLGVWQNVNPSAPLLEGDRARTVFQKANLPIEQLGQVWALTDTKQRGALDMVEFIVAMHLIQSLMNGSLRTPPPSLPPALFEAAARGPAPARTHRQQPSTSSLMASEPLQHQYSGQRQPNQPNMPLRSQLTGPPEQRGSPAPQAPRGVPSEAWDVKPHEKANYDTLFATIDKGKKGYITGEEAVGFFVQSKLPEEDLALVWDLSDVDNSGMLNQDAFAVAMHLIKQKMRGVDLPNILPASLIPPAMRPKVAAPTAAVFAEAQAQAAPPPSSAAADLFGLNESFAPPVPTGSPPVGAFADNFGNNSIDQLASPATSVGRGFVGKPAFVPSSSFGQTIQQQQQQPQASRNFTPVSVPRMDQDLLGDAAPQESMQHAGDATELANLNNSLSSINKQSSSLQQERAQVESEAGNLQSQKVDLTARLAHVRGLYDQQVTTVRAMQTEQAQIKQANTELAKEASLLEASLGAVRQNHEQLTAQLSHDKAENTSIKERIRLANEESATLKAQLETLKKETKQQRGLVAINTKQLTTLEAEHAKLKQSIQEETAAAAAAEKERVETEAKIKSIELERAKAMEEQKQSAFKASTAKTAALTAAAAVPAAILTAKAMPEHSENTPVSGSSPMSASSPVSASMNPFHRATSPTALTTAEPSGIFARLNDGSNDAPAFPFVKTAAAGAAVAGITAGAAAVAFGHASKPSDSASVKRSISPDSVYDTAPNTADADAPVHPAFADAFRSETPKPSAPSQHAFGDDFSQPPAFTEQIVAQDAPRDSAPAEFQVFEHNAPEFDNEASQLHERAIVSPQPIVPAQTWSTEDAFTGDARVASPALAPEAAELKGVRGPSLLGFKASHSDDGSVATSVQAQPPVSAHHSPTISRADTPQGQRSIEASALAQEEQVNAPQVQEVLAHPPHDEERAIPQEAFTESKEEPKKTGITGLLGNIFSSKKEDKGKEPEAKKAASDDSFEHLEAAQEAESSDDETIEQPKGADLFVGAPSSTSVSAAPSSALPIYADNSTSSHLASSPAVAEKTREQSLDTLLPSRSVVPVSTPPAPVVPVATATKPATDEMDEFDDLEEAQEVDEEDEVNQSYMSQEFDPTFETNTARSSMLPPPSAMASSGRAESPAQDWSDFSHYSSVVGDRSSTLAPALPSSAAQAFGLGSQTATGAGNAFDSSFVDSTAKSPPAAPAHRNSIGAAAPASSKPAPAPPVQRGQQPNKPDLTRQVSAADDPMLVELMEMGFDRQKSVGALEKFNYDLGSATHYLLGGN